MALYRFGNIFNIIRKSTIRGIAVKNDNINVNKYISTSVVRFDDDVEITFVKHSGEKMTVKAKVDNSLMDTVCDNELDIDGFGACGGTLTCSTCHLIFKKQDYDRLPNSPVAEEIDMLELANGRTETSRLGCQITVSKDLDKLEVRVPADVSDARES